LISIVRIRSSSARRDDSYVARSGLTGAGLGVKVNAECIGSGRLLSCWSVGMSLSREAGEVFMVQPQLESSAGGFITLGPLRIKMRLGPGSVAGMALESGHTRKPRARRPKARRRNEGTLSPTNNQRRVLGHCGEIFSTEKDARQAASFLLTGSWSLAAMLIHNAVLPRAATAPRYVLMMNCALLCSQCLHRLDRRSAACWNPTRHEGDCGQKWRHKHEGQRVMRVNAVEKAGRQFG
jgi:hypothetical protein